MDKQEEIDDPLVCSVSCEKNVKFDFTKGDFCTVPLNISITNVLSKRAVSFSIETEQHKRIRNKNDYFWTGVTKKNIKSLKPNEVINVQFTACFTEPGVYDLNKIKLTIYKDSTNNEILQTFEERKKCLNLTPVTKILEHTELILKVE